MAAAPERIVQPLPELHLYLRQAEPGTGRRRLAALAGSVLVHCVLLGAGMLGTSEETPIVEPKYRLQILHLQQPTPSEYAAAAASVRLWNSLHPSPAHNKSGTTPGSQVSHPAAGEASAGQPGRAPAAFSDGPRRDSHAPQTLIVQSAPANLKLDQAIPLPTAFSLAALRPAPPTPEQVRLEGARAVLPAAVLPPPVSVISLPDAAQRAPDVVTLPKVNQSAAQDSHGAESTGVGGPKAVAEDAAKARAAAEDAARARAAAEEAAKARAAAEEAAKARAIAEDAANKARTAADEAANKARAAADEAAKARAAAEEVAKARAAAEDVARVRAAEEAARARAAAEQAARARAATEVAAKGFSAAPSGAAGVPSGQPPSAQPGSEDPNLTRIELPPGGKPRAAVLGESPELPGRIVSTVYLKLGLAKNWTLEYWSQGKTAGLDAPWPYTMFRPGLVLPNDADALLVRGLLNSDGRLEQLAMLAPVAWDQKASLFRALELWKFRPAARDGQAVAVEVLLVIPRQPEESER
jgi:hypothetical protein